MTTAELTRTELVHPELQAEELVVLPNRLETTRWGGHGWDGGHGWGWGGAWKGCDWGGCGKGSSWGWGWDGWHGGWGGW